MLLFWGLHAAKLLVQAAQCPCVHHACQLHRCTQVSVMWSYQGTHSMRALDLSGQSTGIQTPKHAQPACLQNAHHQNDMTQLLLWQHVPHKLALSVVLSVPSLRIYS